MSVTLIPPAPPAPKAGPRATRLQRLRYRLQVARREPTAWIGLVLTLVFLYLVLAPIISIVVDALRVHVGDESHAHQQAGEWTSYYLWRVFRSPVNTLLFFKPLLNTLTVAVGVTLFAFVVGGSMAWLLTRTNMPGRKWLATALVVPYMLPSWTFAMAWLTLFKNRKAGGTLGFLEAAGISPPDWLAYGRLPIIVALGLHYSPFVLLLFGNALRRFDSQLEDSARMLGGSKRVIARRIVLPLMLPSLGSATLLIFAKCLGTFGTPYLLGLPVNFDLLSTSLYQNLHTGQNGVASAIAIVIVIMGIALVLGDSRLMKEQKRFVTVGGKGAMNRLTNLRRWRWPVFGVASGVFATSVVMPVLVLILSTVMIKPGDFSLNNFTLQYWIGAHLDSVGFPHGILRGPELWSAAWNSVRVVGIASVICGFLGLLIGYVVVRAGGSRISGFLRQASFLPYLVPGIAFAAAYLSLFAVRRGPIPPLYGTFALLIIVLVVTHLPYSSRSGIAAMMQLGREPEEAAQVCGAGWLTRVRRIVLPIQKGPLAVGVVLPFISGLEELSVVIILTTAGTNLLTTLSISLSEYSYTQLANATVLIIAAVAFGATYLVQKVTGSSLASGLEGA
jgi:iron(III) transport system permease protein